MRRALDHMEDKSSLSLQDFAVCLGKPLKEDVLKNIFKRLLEGEFLIRKRRKTWLVHLEVIPPF